MRLEKPSLFRLKRIAINERTASNEFVFIICRLFAAKCAKCSESFNKNDFVMRARNKTYHPDCFSCEACSRPLVSGDEFALRDERLFCKACTPSRFRAADLENEHEVIEKGHFLQELSPAGGSSISPLSNSNSSSLSAAGSTGGGSGGGGGSLGAAPSKIRLSGKQSPCEGCRLCPHKYILRGENRRDFA